MTISIGGKNIINQYHHYIMTLRLDDYVSLECKGYEFRCITLNDIDILKKGDFAIQNMLPYLKQEKQYSTGLLCIEEKTKQPVGYIWVIRRGGNEMVYRIRNVEALISCVCVFKEYRGKNIANRLLGKVVELLRDEGGTEVALGVRTDNKNAIRAYEKAGFKVTDEKNYLRILRKNFPYHVV